MAHVLVVGGTGMLRDLCLALAYRGHAVSVVAQTRGRLAALAESAREKAQPVGGLINPLGVDYGHDGELHREISGAIRDHGPIALAVCWIHDDSPRALPIIAAYLDGQSPPARIFHLVGSMSVNPVVVRSTDAVAKSFPTIAWRRVVLGFKTLNASPDARSSRWLTHEEIWRGTLAAIDNDWTESVVGLVTPWHLRPK